MRGGLGGSGTACHVIGQQAVKIAESVSPPCSLGARAHGGFTLSVIMDGVGSALAWRGSFIGALAAAFHATVIDLVLDPSTNPPPWPLATVTPPITPLPNPTPEFPGVSHHFRGGLRSIQLTRLPSSHEGAVAGARPGIPCRAVRSYLAMTRSSLGSCRRLDRSLGRKGPTGS